MVRFSGTGIPTYHTSAAEGGDTGRESQDGHKALFESSARADHRRGLRRTFSGIGVAGLRAVCEHSPPLAGEIGR